MNKKVSVMLVLVAFMFALIPLTSATSQTVTIPEGGSQKLTLHLTNGQQVRLNITISKPPQTAGNYDPLAGINCNITDPSDKTFINFNIRISDMILSRHYTFSAPADGTFTLNLKQFTETAPLIDEIFGYESSIIVTVDYEITQADSTLLILGVIIAIIIGIVGVMLLRLAFLKKPKVIITEVPNKLHNLSYDAMLEKKASEITIMRDSMNVSWDDRKKGVLLRCTNAWLSTSQFYHNREFWQIDFMYKASVQDNDSLAIQFIDGTSNVFKLAPDENVILAATRLSGLNRQVGEEALKAYQKARIQQWAETINMLIYKDTYQGPLCRCRYCKTENHAEDRQCINCGAPL